MNAKPLGIAWTPPFRVDVTSAMKPGVNRIEVRVTNEWTNRITGDRALPVGKTILSACPRHSADRRQRRRPASPGFLGQCEW